MGGSRQLEADAPATLQAGQGLVLTWRGQARALAVSAHSSRQPVKEAAMTTHTSCACLSPPQAAPPAAATDGTLGGLALADLPVDVLERVGGLLRLEDRCAVMCRRACLAAPTCAYCY